MIFDLAIWYSFVESPSEIIAAKLSLPHARGTNCTTALASELVESVNSLEIKEKNCEAEVTGKIMTGKIGGFGLIPPDFPRP